jgi:hypothetical protein
LGTISGVTVSHASPAVLTLPSGSLSLNQKFGFATTGSLPTGAFINVTYQVSAVLGGNTYNFISARGTPGGNINTTDAGFGTHTIILADETQIENEIALAAAAGISTGLNNVVKLNAGVFNIYTAVFLPSVNNKFFTLRGAGSGNGLSGGVFVPNDQFGQGGTFTGSISGTTLTVSALLQGNVTSGLVLQTSGGNFTVTDNLGTGGLPIGGGTGNYTVSPSGTVASSTMTMPAPTLTMAGATGTFGTLLLKREIGANGPGGIPTTAADPLILIGPGFVFSDQTLLNQDLSLSDPYHFYISAASDPGLAVGDYVLVNELGFDHNVWLQQNTANFTATISGTNLVVSSISSGKIANPSSGGTAGFAGSVPNSPLSGSGVTGGTVITSGPPGGGVGTYQVSPSQTVSTPTAMTSGGAAPWTFQILNTSRESDVYFFPDENYNPRFNSVQQDYIMQETKRITAKATNTPVSGTTRFTVEAPFRYPMKVSNSVQVVRYQGSNSFCVGVGFEDFACAFGMNNTLVIQCCAYTWIQNVEMYYSVGVQMGTTGCYRCEVRDSFMHENAGLVPGGNYIMAISTATSDSLVENNIQWFANKYMTMQGSGGGNVIAYNFGDDSGNRNFASAQEAGWNCAHWVGSHADLVEGCYGDNFNGDQFWGGTNDIFVYRNWFSGLRSAGGPPGNISSQQLPNYIFGSDKESWIDVSGVNARHAVAIGYGSVRYNFIGNVLGYSGQTLINFTNSAGSSWTQTAFNYEFNGSGAGADGPDLIYGPPRGTGFRAPENQNLPPGNQVYMWQFGWDQAIDRVDGGQDFYWGPLSITASYDAAWRTGNWDWVTAKQIWYANIGDIGTISTGPSVPSSMMPKSLYIPGGGPPAFWGGTTDRGGNAVTPAGGTFPWVDPYTGNCSTMPAKSRFQTWAGIATLPPGKANL